MRKYTIIIGSKSYFESHSPKYGVEYFLDLVRISDERRQRKEQFTDDEKASILLVKNDAYHGIVESAHDRLGALIEDLTKKDAEIYVHNPPAVLFNYLRSQSEDSIIDLTFDNQSYVMLKDSDMFLSNIKDIQKHIIGQNSAIVGISKSLWYLTKVSRRNPYVIMLYGGSSLGKTELVREIARCFFDNRFFEKHLSMFKNDRYSDYFFGQSPNRISFGFELLERESNLIFLDEIDKCPSHFYSAFYTLFDNHIFKDAVYDVDISGVLIILTSNYTSLEEMQANLGLPIYYRIDKFLHFEDFNADVIYEVTMNEILSKKDEYEPILSAEEIYSSVSSKIKIKGENARTIKNKVQMVIEDLLFEKIELSEN